MDDQVTEPVEIRPVRKKMEPVASTAKEELKDVSGLAEDMGLKSWERAGLLSAAGWAEGKQVTRSAFEKALEGFRTRRQGGGRI